jgi:hypothetical protein
MSSQEAAELDSAFERNGWTPNEVMMLSQGDTLARVRQVLFGFFGTTESEHFIDLNADPIVPDGWKILWHIKNRQFKWDAALVTLFSTSDKKDYKGRSVGHVRMSLEMENVFNARLLDYLLAHQQLIPKEWEDKQVLFGGTLYQDHEGTSCIPSLYFNGEWNRTFHRTFHQLDDEYSDDCGFVMHVS